MCKGLCDESDATNLSCLNVCKQFKRMETHSLDGHLKDPGGKQLQSSDAEGELENFYSLIDWSG